MKSYIKFEDTHSFSKIALAYTNGDAVLRPFYQYEPDWKGLEASIEARENFTLDRSLLSASLMRQYTQAGLEQAKVIENIALLKEKNTFTITTAHQPNIFTGPLYFIYKILHVIRIAEECAKVFPDRHFVPVYYMGSEDADLDEIGQFGINGKKYTWQTAQTGAVGRMKVDAGFLRLIAEIHAQVDVFPYGKEITVLFEQCYQLGASIQDCTLKLVDALFGQYGLVVLIPDNAALKKVFEPVVQKELTTQFSSACIAATAERLHAAGFKTQANGRDINLFYLKDDRRERIEKIGEEYHVPALGLHFTTNEILSELSGYPERFSANVILRGVFQETILPNILFVGGGGELAYWLELKEVFKSVGVPYPALLLRNSVALTNPRTDAFIEKYQLEPHHIFLPEKDILDLLVTKLHRNIPDLNADLNDLEETYLSIAQKAKVASPTLYEHTLHLRKNALKKLVQLQQKMQKAERDKLSAERSQLDTLKAYMFPQDNLQERVENIASFYGLHGPDLLDNIKKALPTLPSSFVMLSGSES